MPGPTRHNKVRDFRKPAKFTQAELGSVAGVSRQSIVSIERGDYAPSVYLALRLAQALNTTVETLFPMDEFPMDEFPMNEEQDT